MILVIPSIKIKHGKCACLIQSLPEFPKVYPDDPIKVAKIWRKENARALCLIDVDGEISGRPQNFEIIEKVANEVDIPVIVSGGFKTYEDVKQAIDSGILRVILDPETVNDLKLLKELVNEFTSKRISLKIVDESDGKSENSHAIENSLKVKESGIERIVYKNVFEDENVNFIGLKNFVLKINLKITVEGELNSYYELKKLSDFEKWGVDSIIMGKSLYYNKFPCQRLWRIVENEIDFK